MRVYLGSDHAGFALKARLIEYLPTLGHEAIDCGAFGYDPNDDYPVFCIDAATKAVADPGALAVVIGGSGNGEAIAANKVRGTRAALIWNEETARLCRLHNDANVISLGARMHEVEEAVRLVDVAVSTAFSGEERHLRRIEQLAEYERDGLR